MAKGIYGFLWLFLAPPLAPEGVPAVCGSRFPSVAIELVVAALCATRSVADRRVAIFKRVLAP